MNTHLGPAMHLWHMETHVSERRVTATLEGAPYTTRITARGMAFLADEPADHGGADQGPRPHELLLSSLAACTAITMRMYADRKGWPATPITVTAAMAREQRGAQVDTRIRLDIELPPTLSAEQRERMLTIGYACPVHRTLQNPITITAALTA